MTQKEFNDEIMTGKVLVDFYANWCGPCKMLTPHLRDAEEALKAMDVKTLKVNVDESDELCSEFKISVIPTVAFFIDGKLKSKFVGVKDTEGLIKFVKENS